jgi:hypothetical protein
LCAIITALRSFFSALISSIRLIVPPYKTEQICEIFNHMKTKNRKN